MKPIPGFPKYLADESGKIYSIKKSGKPKRMKTHLHDFGYEMLNLTKDGKHVRSYVHTLILRTFVGKCPKGMLATHGGNGISDNSLSNLSWNTQSQNMIDRWRDNTMTFGECHRNSKLNPLQVRIIRRFCELSPEHGKFRFLATIFPQISVTSIQFIYHRQNWSWLR